MAHRKEGAMLRRQYANIRFTRLAQENHEGMQALVRIPPMKSVFDELARDGHQDEGRGLVVWVSVDGTVAGFKPPVYIGAPAWRANPLLINTPHPDLLQALITYEPQTSYIILVASSDTASRGKYTWWVEQFPQRPKPIDVTRN
jgi:hypothetical protein